MYIRSDTSNLGSANCGILAVLVFEYWDIYRYFQQKPAINVFF